VVAVQEDVDYAKFVLGKKREEVATLYLATQEPKMCPDVSGQQE
jgi:hypothetical protein